MVVLESTTIWYCQVWEDGGASIGCVAHDETGKLLLIAGVLCLYDTILEAERRGAWEAL